MSAAELVRLQRIRRLAREYVLVRDANDRGMRGVTHRQEHEKYDELVRALNEDEEALQKAALQEAQR